MGSYSDRVEQKHCHATDGIDFDEATRPLAPQEHRWDYFIGVRASPKDRGEIIGIEVHTAIDKNVKDVIAKKRASAPLLAAELLAGRSVGRWVWIASGKNGFASHDRVKRQLQEARIEFEPRRLIL